jgi:hypothetical protein
MVGVNGNKFPEIRAHLQHNIAQVYKDLDVSYVVCSCAYGDSMVLKTFLPVSIASRGMRRQIQKPVRPSRALESFYHPHCCIDKVAIDKFNPGDAVVIFTPDSKCLVNAGKLSVRRALFFLKARTMRLPVMRLNVVYTFLSRSQPHNYFRTT